MIKKLKLINRFINKLRFDLKIDKNGNVIFHLLGRIEFLSFPDINFSSLLVGHYHVVADNNIIKFWIYKKESKNYIKVLETTNGIFIKKRK